MFSASKALVCLSALLSLAAAASTASAATFCVNIPSNPTCTPASTISNAVAIAAPGDTVLVGPGTYAEQVTITQQISIVAPTAGAIINATGKDHGIFINGIASTPNPGVHNVIISGLEVENANYEGILVASATNISLIGNHVHNNDKKLTSPTCPGSAPYETDEGQDCGEGIHFMGVDHSNITRNLVENNSGGILMTDETGATFENTVSDNTVRDNGYACGITMASHPAANASGALTGVPDYGLWRNTISGNTSYNNGTLIPGTGAGIGIFAPGPGSTNTANVIIGNNIYSNGATGIAMHNHAPTGGMAPPIYFNDNQIIGNTIHSNAADSNDAHTAGPTGIDIYSLTPITGTVIEKNTFYDETLDIVFNTPAASTLITHFNDFIGNDTGIDNLGPGTIDGTENWWNCPTGPSASCAKATGSTFPTQPVMITPYTY